MDATTEPAAAPVNVTILTGSDPTTTTPSARSNNGGPVRPNFLDELAKVAPNVVREYRANGAERAKLTRELDSRAEDARHKAQAEALARRRHEAEDRWQRLAKRLGSDYRDARLSNFRFYKDPAIAKAQKAAVDTLAAYGKDMVANIKAGRGIVLFGPSGTGKDHCLSALSRVAVTRFDRCVRWVRGSSFCIESRAVMGGNEKQFIESFTRAQILYVSDPLPPVGGLTPHQSAMLYEILDERNRQKRPTWVTLNVANRSDADTRLGAANADRLIERALTIEFDWPSYRAGGVV